MKLQKKRPLDFDDSRETIANLAVETLIVLEERHAYLRQNALQVLQNLQLEGFSVVEFVVAKYWKDLPSIGMVLNKLKEAGLDPLTLSGRSNGKEEVLGQDGAPIIEEICPACLRAYTDCECRCDYCCADRTSCRCKKFHCEPA